MARPTLSPGWHLWCWRDGRAQDLGRHWSTESVADAWIERAKALHTEKGYRALGIRYEARPAGWEPPGLRRVASPRPPDKWPAGWDYWTPATWEDPNAKKLTRGRGPGRPDGRLVDELAGVVLPPRASGRVERVPPPELTALVEQLSGIAQRAR